MCHRQKSSVANLYGRDFSLWQIVIVRTAYVIKGKEVLKLVKSKGFSSMVNQIFMRAFKKEEKFEVWAKKRTDKKYKL